MSEKKEPQLRDSEKRSRQKCTMLKCLSQRDLKKSILSGSPGWARLKKGVLTQTTDLQHGTQQSDRSQLARTLPHATHAQAPSLACPQPCGFLGTVIAQLSSKCLTRALDSALRPAAVGVSRSDSDQVVDVGCQRLRDFPKWYNDKNTIQNG